MQGRSTIFKCLVLPIIVVHIVNLHCWDQTKILGNMESIPHNLFHLSYKASFVSFLRVDSDYKNIFVAQRKKVHMNISSLTKKIFVTIQKTYI